MQPRSFCIVQNLQPQYAALLAISAVARHRIPAAGDHVLVVDIGDGLRAEQAVSDLSCNEHLATSDVACERIGSALEFLGRDVKQLEVLANSLGRYVPAEEIQVTECQLFANLSFDHANQLNRARNGSLLIPGDSLLILLCRPINLVGALANQLENATPEIRLVDVDTRSGRLLLSGSIALLENLNSKYKTVS